MKILVISVLTYCAIACSNTPNTEVENNPVVKPENIETTEENLSAQIIQDVEENAFNEKINSGKGILLDVRTADEYAQGHINGSINLDFNSGEFESALDTLNKQTPVYVYCQGGGRSGKAKNMMADKGFSEVYNLIGGYGSWPY